MAKFLVRAPQFRALSDGDSTPLGEIEISQEGSEWSLIEIDDDTETAEQKLQNAQDNGTIREFKRESTLYPMGVIHPPKRRSRRFNMFSNSLDANKMGQDFITSGISMAWQENVQKTQNVIVGVADTGKIPNAAHSAHAPEVDIIHVYGGNDTHGHQTACTLRIVGTRGVLNKARRCITAQALPNGRGSTSDIVNSIRALRNWRGANGEKVRVISLSLGMDGRDPIIDREIIDTQSMGVICVAAMGNSGWGIQSTGTPAAVCMFAAGATTFDGTRPAIFSTGGCNLPEETGAGPGENVGLAHLDGGYGDGDGTSFWCPVLAAIVAGALEIGWITGQIKEYLMSNQRGFNPPRRRGLIRLDPTDFNTENGGNVVDFDEIIWRAQEMDARIAEAQNARAGIENGTLDWNVVFNRELGPGRDLMREVIELAKAGKVGTLEGRL